MKKESSDHDFFCRAIHVNSGLCICPLSLSINYVAIRDLCRYSIDIHRSTKQIMIVFFLFSLDFFFLIELCIAMIDFFFFFFNRALYCDDRYAPCGKKKKKILKHAKKMHASARSSFDYM